MKELKVAFLDFDPSSGLGETLKSILQACPSPAIEVSQESIPTHDSHSQRIIYKFLQGFKGELIFLVLPSTRLEEARLFLHAWGKGEIQPPVMGIVEDAIPDETMELLQMGMLDFITPPLKSVDVLPRIWRALREKNADEILLHNLKKKIGLQQLVGKSPAFLAEVQKIPLIARCDASVLISGETGTGKEICARAIHYLSPRAGRPFIPVNCGAIPTELLENELFGHEKGAFTGASTSYPGLIHESTGGTLFLDEIDCLPLQAQVKLLPFLQDKEYRQLGSIRVHQADVRIIAASNLDLEKAVKEKKFRQDLFYRLNIIPLLLPPLRDRLEDIPLLAKHFLDKCASEFDKPVKNFTKEALQQLLVYDWPGNVRELENMVERAIVFCEQTVVQPSDILIPSREKVGCESFRVAKTRAVEQFEKKYIQGLLLANQGNISRAARTAQKNRRAFWELIRKHQINVQSFKDG